MNITNKSLIAGVFLALSSNVAVAASAAEDVIGTFQWIGTVPTAVPGTNWKIINTGLVDHLSGTVTFTGTAGAYEIADSSELIFSVVDGGTSDTPAISFDYALTSLRFSAGAGFMTDANGEFTITGDGANLAVGNTNNVTGSEVVLKVTTTSTTAVVDAGDEVIIQAIILVNNQL